MGYENPLLKLPAGQALRRLPKDDRARIEAVMRELRDQANTEAENAWRRRKGPMAAYWRAASEKLFSSQPCTAPIGVHCRPRLRCSTRNSSALWMVSW